MIYLRTFLIGCALLPIMLLAQELPGTWQGVLAVQGMELRLVLHIEEGEVGYTGTMDSPDQGALGIPVDEITFTDGQLSLRIDQLKLGYTGTYDAEAAQFIGDFQQGGMSLPLSLGRETLPGPPPRPQDPTNFPYQVESVSFVNPNGGHELAGTLTIPESGAAKAVVVLISGSGPQNRDEELEGMNHRPFLVLSDFLTRKGIAVLRYDDRGVAESKGDFATATSHDFATDAAAAVAYLGGREDLADLPLGLAGHSEGGLIAPIVATELAKVDYLVLLSGPGIPSDELLLRQSELISTAEGVPTEAVEANHRVLRLAYTYLKEHPDASEDSVQAGLIDLLRKGLEDFPPELLKDIADLDTFVQNETKPLITPWFRYFIAFDPAPYLEQVTQPVLALNGSLDLQVPASENLAGIRQALPAHEGTLIQALPGLNHLFQHSETGSPSEYAQIEETFAPEAMQIIADWILAR